MASKCFKEVKFKDCTITIIADIIFVDLKDNKDILEDVANYLWDKLDGIIAIEIDYIHRKPHHSELYRLRNGKWGDRYYGSQKTVANRLAIMLNERIEKNELHR